MWRLRSGWLSANAGKAYANAHHVYVACAAMGSDITGAANCSNSCSSTNGVYFKMRINVGPKLSVQMRFLKFTLILRGVARCGNWDQGSSCPFCGLAFHLGWATRCRQHFGAHIFLFTLLWSCLLGHVPRATCRALYCSRTGGLRGRSRRRHRQFGFPFFMGSLGIFCIFPFHLQFCSLHLFKRQKVKLV